MAEEGASMRCGSTNKPQMCDVSSTPDKARRLLISVPQLRGAHHSQRSAHPPLRSDVAPSDLLPHSAHVTPTWCPGLITRVWGPRSAAHTGCRLTPQPQVALCNLSPTLTAAKFRLQNSHDCKLHRALNQLSLLHRRLRHQNQRRPKASSAGYCAIASHPHLTRARPKRPRTHSALAPAAPCTRCTLLSASHHASVQGPAFLDTSPRLKRPPKEAKPHWRTAFLSALAPAYPRPRQHRQP
ncbi:hypothetical protein BKA58DRAFT_154078 [Alternaria rosae]|uniref:uncharacterized protein n=1 Tax=Alternaria rosae TaxID=1187941 RepID=UPI001E8CFD32|nr:uncharacterized protein BKA58DRAFT_154078 [Alternaria rosae]KAH6872846.1 hypothetical protein BKA58DRAFT_154078 [Alternaria rosae]